MIYDSDSTAPPIAALIGAMRRRGHEAQWTQMIAATATAAGGACIRALAAALLDTPPYSEARLLLGEVPERLEVTAERSYPPHGTVDLVFSGVEQPWELLCELKLHSGYGHQQIPRYLAAIDAMPITAKGLIAVTKYRPPVGENVSHPAWLGSIRWSQILDDLADMPISDPILRAGWQAALRQLHQQGDFGMVQHADDVMDVWARRDEAEGFVRELLTRLGPEVEVLIRAMLGTGPDDLAAARMLMSSSSKSQPIVAWKNKPHIDYAVPAAAGEPRLRLQFLAFNGAASFTFETRYEHPHENLKDDEAVQQALVALDKAGMHSGNDGNGHYCALVLPAKDWLGPQAVDHLLGEVAGALDQFTQSGLLNALSARHATTPVTSSAQKPISSD